MQVEVKLIDGTLVAHKFPKHHYFPKLIQERIRQLQVEAYPVIISCVSD